MRTYIPFAILSLLLLAACGKKEQAKRGPVSVPVEVAVAERRDIPLDVPSVGTVEPVATVQVKPKVGGELEKVFFEEGAVVEAGQTLFQIDSRPYDAVLKRAQANVDSARVQATNAEEQLSRYETLIKGGSASQEQYSQYLSAANSQQSTLKAREADAEEAALSREWTSVKAPIPGKTGAILVKPGNIVQANGEALTVINQIKPIYVNFSIPEGVLGALRARMAKGDLPVNVYDSEGEAQLATGKLVFIDNTVDRTTGMVSLKAAFENGDEKLWPGQFVDVKLTLDEDANALVIPTTAVMENLEGAHVFVVEDGKVSLKPVKVQRSFGALSLITSGLEEGQKVVTSGQLRVTEGGAVTVKKEIPSSSLIATANANPSASAGDAPGQQEPQVP